MTEGRERFGRGRLMRGGTVVLVGTLIQKAANLILLAILGRELGASDFAVYAFAFAFGLFFETLSDFGIDNVTTRELNREADDNGRILGSAIAAKAAAMGCTVVLALGVAMIYDGELRKGAMLATLGILAGIPGTLGIALKARVENFQPVAIATASIVLGAVTVFVAARRGVGPVGLVAIQTGFRVGSSALAMPLLRRRLAYRLRVDAAVVRRLVRASAPLAVSTIAVVIMARIDQLVLGAISSRNELALYAGSVRIVDGLNVLPVAIATVFLPTLSHLSGRDDERFARLSARGVRYLGAVLLPLAALATVEGEAIVAAVFGSDFEGSGVTLAVLLWAHFFGSVWVLNGPALIARDRTTHLAALSISAAVVIVGLNALLIPEFGSEGAAWSSLVGYAFPFAMATFMPSIRATFVAPLRAAARPLIAALAVLGALLLAPGGLLIAVAVFAAVAPVAILLTRSAVPAEAREMVVSFARGR